MKLAEKLLKVQAELKAPKTQTNEHMHFKFRNCEDIIEAAKPLLLKHGLLVTLNDEIILIGNRFYIKATATAFDIESDETHSVSANARESDEKKGMDVAQITGASSSYARKYALNGLFMIDDTKDADSNENAPQVAKSSPKGQSQVKANTQKLVMVDKDGTKLLKLKEGWRCIGEIEKELLIKMLASGYYEEAREEITDAINVG